MQVLGYRCTFSDSRGLIRVSLEHQHAQADHYPNIYSVIPSGNVTRANIKSIIIIVGLKWKY